MVICAGEHTIGPTAREVSICCVQCKYNSEYSRDSDDNNENGYEMVVEMVG